MNHDTNQRFRDALDVAAGAAVVSSAWSTGLLPTVLEAPATAAELAGSLGLSLRAVEPVLEALVALDLLGRDGARYGPPSIDLPLPISRIARMFGSLPGRLRGEGSSLRMDGDPTERAEAYATIAGFIGVLQRPAAAELARLLGPVDRVLDIGAGSGVWSLEMARQGAMVTAVDLAPVLEVFESQAAALEVPHTAVAGDFHQVRFPQVDRAIIANVLHLESEEAAARLVTRAVASLASGGQLVVVEPTGSDTPDRARRKAMYGVQLMLRAEVGQAWQAPDITRWMSAAGLRDVRILPLHAGVDPLEAVVGTKL